MLSLQTFTSENVSYVNNLDHNQVNKDILLLIQESTENNETLCKLKEKIAKGWPDDKPNIHPNLIHIFRMEIR